jgi:hypothetical protein
MCRLSGPIAFGCGAMLATSVRISVIVSVQRNEILWQSVAKHKNSMLELGQGERLAVGRWGKRTTKFDHKQPQPLLSRP